MTQLLRQRRRGAAPPPSLTAVPPGSDDNDLSGSEPPRAGAFSFVADALSLVQALLR